MFLHKHMTDTVEFALPHDPYNSQPTLFAEPQGITASFRIQRLGTYLISNLFSADYMGKSEFVHDKRLVTLCRGKELYFTGELFDQWDLDVLLYCAMNTPARNSQQGQFQFSPADLLHSLNLRNSAINRQRVYDSLQRLHTGDIDIRGDQYRYMTRLINRVLVNEIQGLCLVEINSDVTTSFRMSSVPMEINDRRALSRNGLAKWLHGATMVFKGGFTAEINSLYDLCRIPTRQQRSFVSRLEQALEHLMANGHIESWSIDNNRVRVTSQATQVRNTACGMFYSDVCA
jgi:hypothetical protein